MGNPVVHFEIGGSDATKSRAFYSELFGWSATLDRNGYAVMDTGSDAGIAGGIAQTPPGVPPWVTFYVRVTDLEGSLVRAAQLGGRRVTGPVAVAAGAFAMIADPDGNVVGLFEEPAR